VFRRSIDCFLYGDENSYTVTKRYMGHHYIAAGGGEVGDNTYLFTICRNMIYLPSSARTARVTEKVHPLIYAAQCHRLHENYNIFSNVLTFYFNWIPYFNSFKTLLIIITWCITYYVYGKKIKLSIAAFLFLVLNSTSTTVIRFIIISWHIQRTGIFIFYSDNDG